MTIVKTIPIPPPRFETPPIYAGDGCRSTSTHSIASSDEESSDADSESSDVPITTRPTVDDSKSEAIEEPKPKRPRMFCEEPEEMNVVRILIENQTGSLAPLLSDDTSRFDEFVSKNTPSKPTLEDAIYNAITSPDSRDPEQLSNIMKTAFQDPINALLGTIVRVNEEKTSIARLFTAEIEKYKNRVRKLEKEVAATRKRKRNSDD
jgi:hypothetical protein